MANEQITVLIKNMIGDLVEVSFDPTEGLTAAAAALTVLDPLHYPRGRTTVFSLSEEGTPLDEAFLCSVIAEDPICQLISHDEVTVQGTNASYDHTYIHWQFRLESQEDCHVYLLYSPSIRQLMETAIRRGVRIFPKFDITYQAPMYVSGSSGYTSISRMLNNSRTYMNVRDTYVIHDVLKKTMPAGFESDKDTMEHVFCPCGYVVESKKMRAHQNTKHKHRLGDDYGKEFLARADAYIASI